MTDAVHKDLRPNRGKGAGVMAETTLGSHAGPTAHTTGHVSTSLERIDRLLIRTFGIQNLPQRGWLLGSRVQKRAAELGLQGVDAYASLLEGRGGAGELAHLFELVRIGQTSWMRHAQYLDQLTRRELLGHRSNLSIWSAGCGTGQEAYSVAMLLLETGHSDFQVLGTDQSARAIEQAARGYYDADACEGLDESLRRKYWLAHANGIEAGMTLRRTCSFSIHNLLSDPLPKAQDAILCRNVLMYFEPSAARQVLDRLISALRPGGLLLLGPSELATAAAKRLEPVRRGAGLAWRRPESPSGKRHQSSTMRPRPPGDKSVEDLSARQPEQTPEQANQGGILLEGSYPVERLQELEQTLSSRLRAGTGRLLVDLDGATFLCDEAARVILRAAHHMEAFGGSLGVKATRLGVKRWVRRCGLSHLAVTQPGGRPEP